MYREKTIIMAGLAASRAALSILEDRKEELKLRYPGRYLKDARTELKNGFVDTDIIEELKEKYENICLVPCGSGGIFAALWELGELLDTGLMIESDRISVAEPGIELCDHSDISPYEAESEGAYIIASEEPGKILRFFKEKNVRSVAIGWTMEKKARIVKGCSERYLTRPDSRKLSVSL